MKEPTMKPEDWNPEHTVRVVGPGGEVSAREAELMERIEELEGDPLGLWFLQQHCEDLEERIVEKDRRIEKLEAENKRLNDIIGRAMLKARLPYRPDKHFCDHRKALDAVKQSLQARVKEGGS